MKKIITVSIIGCGARGGIAYGEYINQLKDKYRIVSLCDVNPSRLNKFGDLFGVPCENRFEKEEEFWKEKRSDLLLVCTLDHLHVPMAERGLKLGYDLLLEKPISDNPSELRELLAIAKESKRRVMVCHVLRYTAMMRKIKELLDEGAIGRLISVDHTENVVFWHEAHSYVRGNWHSKEETTSMIMAKCCHDLDLLQYFIGSRCKSVSSMGDLRYFKKENAPEGCADRCCECRYEDTCVYSAKRIYIEQWKNVGCPASEFPFNLVSDASPTTEEALEVAVKESRYGKCVFRCDNDVVDNQTTIMQFENGVTATLKMEAFVKYGGRDIRFFGTEGELDLRESENTLVLKKYFGKDTVWKISELVDDLGGQGTGAHGGGDHRMIDKLYSVLTDPDELPDTSLEKSLESHYMAIAAEESRIRGGELVELNQFRK